jgi:hypothetical protein
MTPLHHACASEHDNTAILKMLIDNAADVDAVNKAGESPLRLAINQKGPQSAKAKYIRTRGGKDIGPRAVQASRSGPPAPQPQPQPAPRAPQNYNPPNYNIACDLNSSPDRKFSFLQSTSPQWVGFRSRDASSDSSSHRAELRRIADQEFDFLDDFVPLEFKRLSPWDQSTVLEMVREMEDRAQHAEVGTVKTSQDYLILNLD